MNTSSIISTKDSIHDKKVESVNFLIDTRNLPEKARERICYMIEGALLVKEPEKEKGDFNVREQQLQ